MNIVDQIRRDWETHQQRGTHAIPGQPWGYQWGGATIFEQMEAYNVSQYLTSPVLDVGCGGGKWSKWLIDTWGLEVIGIDVHPVAIQQSQAYEPRATYKLTDGESLPFGDGEVGSVFIFDVLLHLPMPLVERYFQEAHRVARHSLLFVLPDMDTERGAAMFMQAVRAKVWQVPFTYGYMTYYTRGQVEAMLRLAGWEEWQFLGHVGVAEPREMLYVAYK